MILSAKARPIWCCWHVRCCVIRIGRCARRRNWASQSRTFRRNTCAAITKAAQRHRPKRQADMATLSQLQVADWEILRRVRLLALQSDPSVFGSNHAREAAYTPDIWREWLDTPDTAIFGVFDGADIAGLTSISVKRDDASRTVAKLWGSWLRADLRGQGLSVPMYRARLDWARAHPTIETVEVSHRRSEE